MSRLLIVAIAALVAALLAVSMSAPQQAMARGGDDAERAAAIESTIVPAGHIGWVNVRDWNDTDTCGIVGPCGVEAWSWGGKSWTSTRIGWGTGVYAYPFSGSWQWVWTSRTGWLAIQRADLTRRPT